MNRVHARYHVYDSTQKQASQAAPTAETTALRRQSSYTTTVVDSVNVADMDPEKELPFIPVSLRPRSVSFARPPSVRSSTLYAFSPTQERAGSSSIHGRRTLMSDSKTKINAHAASASSTTLPNPHSSHGHGGEDDESMNEVSLNAPLLHTSQQDLAADDSDPVKNASDTSFATPTGATFPNQSVPPPASVTHSDSSLVDDAIISLERGPTPMSRSSTYSSQGRHDNLHDLLMSRQGIPGTSPIGT
ncbi:uncharacterized protein LAESUDRAFT_365239 [Laetiporus sulphureus 93-53]|uniref:Uncharacterized protein n=1 Tax=Laetiporus sulphureus 93-53 TaxID=1314785 RepID=A0A165H0H4_9APHY|nr:uncharacterized protein LAESUDRAFT_365239 [Laetiporus sulphureus 93-53]KZT11081.1 hypothetical protein LAESUDRAFT_365239 [Laetiporus sulphureus 93-53]